MDKFIEENGGLKGLDIDFREDIKEDGGYIISKGNVILNKEFKNFHKEYA